MADATTTAKKSDLEKCTEATTDAKRKFYKSKRVLKDFEQVHGMNPKGKPARDWAGLVDTCNVDSVKWNECKTATTAAVQAEQDAAREDAAA